MEARLREYRAQRRRRELIENTKEKVAETKEKIVRFLTPKFLNNMDKKDEDFVLVDTNDIPVPDTPEIKQDEHIEVASEVSELESFEEPKPESWRYFTVKWTLYTISWLTLYLFFLQLQFGAVFFVISALFGIYLNTRTRPQKKGEVSAYSVFNDNCVSIDGTLKAEQFEREIMYGAGSVR